MSGLPRPAVDRFAEKVALTDSGCVEWIAGTNGIGYGVFHVGRTRANRGVKLTAHRWSYEYHVGPVPEGMHIDHLCRNRACVNPDHLDVVTHKENVLRGESPTAANAQKTHCPRGHELSGANLYVRPATGQRSCKTCARERKAERYRLNSQGRDLKTHCPHGHPYAGDNLVISSTTGQRICRTCRRRWSLANYYRNRKAS